MSRFNSLRDIERLIENKEEESLTLEYKRELDRKNKEIAKDISAFTNTKGGAIIYGIEEEKRIPISINWLGAKDTKEKIENIILDNIHPRIKDVVINPFSNPDDSSQAIFVVEIPESPDSPHMADYRYYRRHNFKSIPMEDYEVKDAIFRKGLRKSLFFEICKNIELCEKSFRFIQRISSTKSELRKSIVFIPFHTDAWNAIISSGLLFVLKEKAEKLVEAYSYIHEINFLIDCQKFGVQIINTPLYESLPEHGTYIPVILNEKIARLYGLLRDLKNSGL